MGSMLGQGSFATVHKARIIATGREVAVKVVRPESELDFGTGPNGSTPDVSYQDVLKAMKLEVKIVEVLGKHPYLVELIGTTEECKVFVMEKAASDLYSIVKQQERNLPLHIVAQWSEQMLEATRFMHERGIVHQDIKSSNVLIFADRTAKMCDFGLARQGSNVMCVDRELVTLWYRAPELLMGESVYTPRVDEWGVGCMLLEMIIGCSPFRGKPECVCSCPQITHRNYNSDQLMKIFAMLGTPKERVFLARMSCQAHFSRWPLFPRKLEQTIRKCISMERASKWVPGKPQSEEELQLLVDEWIELIGGLLNVNPEKRTEAEVAVQFVQNWADARPRGPKSPKSPVENAPGCDKVTRTASSGNKSGEIARADSGARKAVARVDSGERAALDKAGATAAATRSSSRRSSFSGTCNTATHSANHHLARKSSDSEGVAAAVSAARNPQIQRRRSSVTKGGSDEGGIVRVPSKGKHGTTLSRTCSSKP